MPKLETIRAAALREYEKDAADDSVSFPYSPARAVRARAARKGYPTVAGLRSIVDPIYFRENGARAPFPASASKGGASLGRAIRARRAKGGTLGRWESLASAASVALGRTVSVPATKALAERAGVDLATSYVGRGTKARLAESVRADDAAALADAAAAE